MTAVAVKRCSSVAVLYLETLYSGKDSMVLPTSNLKFVFEVSSQAQKAKNGFSLLQKHLKRHILHNCLVDGVLDFDGPKTLVSARVSVSLLT